MYKFLPSYVGSKSFWVPKLEEFRGLDFIEPFCGSAVISANLARTAVLNDLDDKLYQILSNFKDLICPESFSSEDYEKYKWDKDWWKYVYCLQKMSFSGVFRYSKNGYNVPIKSNMKGKSVSLTKEFQEAQERMKELNPVIANLDYCDIPHKAFCNRVAVFDPPYQGSQASYNGAFDYVQYWEFIKDVVPLCEVAIVFDRLSNLENRFDKEIQTRKMVVNGKHKPDTEAMVIIDNRL